MNFFQEGVVPKWEDQKNKGGKSLNMEYRIDRFSIGEFLKEIEKAWLRLILSLVGGTLIGADYVIVYVL